MSKRFLFILALCALVLGGIFWFTRDKANAPSTDNGETSAHVQGAGNKGVTLIEYGDFQCPACYNYYPVVQQIKAKYGDDITFQFRHFPLIQLHPNAMAAHRAAEAAGQQGRFFEMHDVLYEQQQTWSPSSNAPSIFERFAEQLGLNMEQYKQDVNSSKINSIINADIKAGQALGANSTPTFVLNGQKLDQEPASLDGFSKLIDDEIARQSPNGAE